MASLPLAGVCLVMRTGVLTADDHAVVRAGVAALIAKEPDLELCAEAKDGAEAVRLYEMHQPDVVLMDLRMPGMDGVAAIRAIVAGHPGARVVALTSFDGDADIYRALDAGAFGYLLKDMLGAEVIEAIRSAAAGKRVIPPDVAGRLAEVTPPTDLTDRELDVLRLAARGLPNRPVADAIRRAEAAAKVRSKHRMSKT